jgi:hypothetical protein
MLELVREGLAVAFAAFAGASLAFLRERFTARVEKEKRDYAALREAHFALMQQNASLILLRDQFLAPGSKSPAPWLTMQPIVGFFDAPRLDVSKLVYILEGRDPDLLNRMLVAQQKYSALQTLFEQRNLAHGRLQDLLGGLQRQGVLPSSAPVHEVERLVGQPTIGQLKTLTAAILERFAAVLTFQEQQLSDIAAYSARAFPKRRVPKFAVLPEAQRK